MMLDRSDSMNAFSVQLKFKSLSLDSTKLRFEDFVSSTSSEQSFRPLLGRLFFRVALRAVVSVVATSCNRIHEFWPLHDVLLLDLAVTMAGWDNHGWRILRVRCRPGRGFRASHFA